MELKILADTIASGVTDIYANMSAFAALKADGSSARGLQLFGGITYVMDSVKNKIFGDLYSDFEETIDISSTGTTFAAI